MTNSPFDDAVHKAEAAIAAHRGVKKPQHQGKDELAPRRMHKTIDGLNMASVDYVDEATQKLRDDFNDVFENFEASAGLSTRVEVTCGGVDVGSVDGLTHFQFPKLLLLCSIKDGRNMRMNIMLKGEMGGGKSTAGKQVAEALGLDFGYLGQTIMPHDVLGYVSQVTGDYYPTDFTRIFENGGVLMLEEMDGWSPSATLCTNTALANGYLTLPNGVMVNRHEDCVIIACTNTWGTGPTAKYVGRNKLDDAFLDRFGVKMDWRYDANLERAAAGNDEVVDVVQNARLNAKRAGVMVSISPRSSIDISKMVAAGLSIREAVGLNFGSALDVDQLALVLEDCDI